MNTPNKISLYPDVDIYNGYYGVWVKNRNYDGTIEKTFYPVGRACKILSIQKELETRAKTIVLQCEADNPNSIHQFSRDEIYNPNPAELLKYGVDAQKGNLSTLHRLFQKMEENEEEGHCHRGLGWFQDSESGDIVFRTDKLIAGEDDIPSTYIGGYAVAPAGDRKAWYSLVRKYCKHTPLAFIIAAGLSSVLVGYLNLHHVEVSNPIIHLSGKSSTGKTTAGMLFLSTAASPRTGSGLYLQWNDTQNGIIQAMAGVEGYPFLIDESSAKSMDYTSIIYTIANRRDKRRYNAAEPQPMSVTVLSTGEASLRDSCNRNNGLDVRLMEFSGVNWTPSARAADKIKKVVQENYGFAIEDFVASLILSDTDDIVNDFSNGVQQVKKCILKKVPTAKRFADRIAAQLALIHRTAIYLNSI